MNNVFDRKGENFALTTIPRRMLQQERSGTRSRSISTSELETESNFSKLEDDDNEDDYDATQNFPS